MYYERKSIGYEVVILFVKINETFYLINLLVSLTLFKHSVTSTTFFEVGGGGGGGAFTILYLVKGALCYIVWETALEYKVR